VFLFFTLLNIAWVLCGRQGLPLTQYLELPAWPLRWLQQPWSIVTYMLLHADVLHLLFNMIWLYAFGRLFQAFYTQRQLRGLYLLGGIVGGAVFMLAYNVFPYFSQSANYYASGLIGASAAVMAIMMATVCHAPEYRLQFMFIGSVRLKYVALFMVLTDLLFMTSDNAGGHIAHLGGVLAGWAYARSLSHGRDLTAWINKMIDAVLGLGQRQPKRKKPKMEGHFGGRASDYTYNANRRQKSEEVDRILEKLKKSGYDSLSEDEKKSLFDASKR
jgi:membrane associated rhomboid family serine protease